MDDLSISLLHPTARPEKWRAVWNAWYAAAEDPERIEYVLVPEWRFSFDDEPDLPGYGSNKAVRNEGRPCLVDAFNTAAKASTAKVLVTVADDFFPCQFWDTKLLGILGNRIDAETVVWCSTDCPNDTRFICHPILTRKYYERYGYLFHSDYQGWYADNEFSDVAHRDGVVMDARHVLTFEHRHYSLGKADYDATYLKHHAESQQGEALYSRRRAQGFPR